MENNYIFYDKVNPVTINLIELKNSKYFFDKNIKILCILQGEVNVSIENKSYFFAENDLYILNSHESLSINNLSKQSSHVLEISINSFKINDIFPCFSDYLFYGNSKLDSVSEKYIKLRSLIMEIIRITNTSNEKNNYTLIVKTIELCHYLISQFKVLENIELSKKNKINYIKNIINFLEMNYKDENLNVTQIADYLGLSPQYILKIFKDSIKIGLMEYLNTIRIDHSISALLNTKDSILEIAIDVGFNNIKTFTRAFKKNMNLNPSEYRKINRDSFNNKSYGFVDNFDIINKFLQKEINHKAFIEREKENVETIPIELNLNETHEVKVEKYWNKVLSLGKAFEGLKGEIKYQIEEITSEIEFEYIKINNIFSDELFIYNEEEDGKIIYNFAYIDKLIDYFLSLKLKPYINIGFTPKKMKSAEQYVISSNVSYPKNIDNWLELIKSLFTHFKNKYREKAEEWKFEIWNNPNAYKNYWYESDIKYFEFYKETFLTIKNVSQNFQVGGPSVIIVKDISYISNFFDFMKMNSIEIDFYTFNFYNIKELVGSINQSQWKIKYYDYQTLKYLVKDFLNNLNISNDKEIFISEWNSSPYYKDLTHDTCFMNTYIIDCVSNNFNVVSSMSYWTLIESRLSSDLFHGGFGLFTIDNLKKSSYNAFILLNKLGHKLIRKDNSYIITKNQYGYQILLYNHIYYNNKYISGNFDDITYLNRYNIFEQDSTKEIIVNFIGLDEGAYSIKKYFLNKKSGSIFDAWLEMGAPSKLNKEIYDYLKSKEKMRLFMEEKYIKDSYNTKEILESHDVIFIEIEKKHDGQI